MRVDKRDQLVGRIYDAALDEAQWPGMLVGLADAMNCKQSNLVMVDPSRGAVKTITPLWDPSYRKSFFEHWQKQFSLAKRTEHIPVGRVFTYDDLFDLDWLRATAFYNEWWRPQGVGGGSLGANLICDGRATALVTVHAGYEKQGFSGGERRTFNGLVQHLIRAITVQRKLQLAHAARDTDPVPSGFAILDRDGHVLDAGGGMLAALRRIGILARDSRNGRIESASGAIESLARAAASGSGGHVDLTGPDGEVIRATVIPCSEQDRTETRLIAIDRPAALLSITFPGERDTARMRRLIEAYSLTPAEAAVAIETAKGDGRAAVAARLGIRATTVRSHLTAIFDKTGLHRQAELVRLVDAS